jgi:hypothetical protein
MFGGWTETDWLPHIIMKYRPCGRRSQGDATKELLNINGTGAGD